MMKAKPNKTLKMTTIQEEMKKQVTRYLMTRSNLKPTKEKVHQRELRQKTKNLQRLHNRSQNLNPLKNLLVIPVTHLRPLRKQHQSRKHQERTQIIKKMRVHKLMTSQREKLEDLKKHQGQLRMHPLHHQITTMRQLVKKIMRRKMFQIPHHQFQSHQHHSNWKMEEWMKLGVQLNLMRLKIISMPLQPHHRPRYPHHPQLFWADTATMIMMRMIIIILRSMVQLLVKQMMIPHKIRVGRTQPAEPEEIVQTTLKRMRMIQSRQEWKAQCDSSLQMKAFVTRLKMATRLKSKGEVVASKVTEVQPQQRRLSAEAVLVTVMERVIEATRMRMVVILLMMMIVELSTTMKFPKLEMMRVNKKVPVVLLLQLHLLLPQSWSVGRVCLVNKVGIAATKIQASFRGHKARREAEKAEKAKQSDAELSEELQKLKTTEEKPAAEEEEDLPDLNDPEVNKAATKIQAHFKGHLVRKTLKDPKDASN
ncbi:unnamed protein product [Orchesella dallaii]|uniref:Uncharacterized protein n=1 Tax=Orchesella dallaii TaxID=48710 RepID=A0ABP1QSN3_9HEXA